MMRILFNPFRFDGLYKTFDMHIFMQGGDDHPETLRSERNRGMIERLYINSVCRQQPIRHPPAAGSTCHDEPGDMRIVLLIWDPLFPQSEPQPVDPAE